MGDRGNIYVTPADVHLYTHWGASELPITLKAALDRKQRWGDSPYLTRIIFDAMTELEGASTGFGISHGLCDHNYGYPIIVVDTDAKEVSFRDYEGRATELVKAFGTKSFAEYIAMDDDALMEAFHGKKDDGG